MPKEIAKKTASVPELSLDESSQTPRRASRKKLFLAMVIVVILSISFAAFLNSAAWACHAYQVADGYRKDKTVKIEGSIFETELVEKPDDQRRGLSNRPCIGENQAMLFAYDEPGKLCFWMKDMRFPIDIVWLDAEQKIITIRENVDPSTYPQNFCPNGPAQFVLEFKAGTVSKHRFADGQQAIF